METDMKNVFLLALTASLTLTACTKCSGDKGQKNTGSEKTSESDAPAIADGLKLEDLKVGDGALAEKGKLVTVHYVGSLVDGKKFDSSRDRNQAFSFTLGAGQIISGLEKGVEGMKVGGKRNVPIPPKLGYGAAGVGETIPPNATLLFEVELLEVKDAPVQQSADAARKAAQAPDAAPAK